MKGDPHHVDPALLLLDDLLVQLPDREARIAAIKRTLGRGDVWEGYHSKEAIRLVEALEALYLEEPHCDAIGFRAYLMELSAARSMVKENRGYPYDTVETAAVDLHLLVLQRIIAGWRWDRIFGFGLSLVGADIRTQSRDADVCFRFLCAAYERAPRWEWTGDSSNPFYKRSPGKIREGILNLFKEADIGASTNDVAPWDLDPWILRPDVPKAISAVLFEVRDELGGLSFRLRELRALQNDTSTKS
ncbi:MAG: hypothetical protein WD850_02900 [Candidatus Spechtbacterales bacterium]